METFIVVIVCVFILSYCWKQEQEVKDTKAEFMARIAVLARKEKEEKADLLARVEALEKLIKS